MGLYLSFIILLTNFISLHSCDASLLSLFTKSCCLFVFTFEKPVTPIVTIIVLYLAYIRAFMLFFNFCHIAWINSRLYRPRGKTFFRFSFNLYFAIIFFYTTAANDHFNSIIGTRQINLCFNCNHCLSHVFLALSYGFLSSAYRHIVLRHRMFHVKHSKLTGYRINKKKMFHVKHLFLTALIYFFSNKVIRSAILSRSSLL